MDDEKPLRLTDEGVAADTTNADDDKPVSASQISGIFGSSNLEQLNRKAANGKKRKYFFSLHLVK